MTKNDTFEMATLWALHWPVEGQSFQTLISVVSPVITLVCLNLLHGTQPGHSPSFCFLLVRSNRSGEQMLCFCGQRHDEAGLSSVTWWHWPHQNCFSVSLLPFSPLADYLHHSGSRWLWLWREAWRHGNTSTVLLLCLTQMQTNIDYMLNYKI